jgi:uncharacterized protein YciI
MVFVVELVFGDHPDRLAARPAHRQRLQRLHDNGFLLAAGPFADDSGALLIFDVSSPADLTRILHEDPYYQTPGVTIVRQQDWTPIIS